jgi:hypothetical protein
MPLPVTATPAQPLLFSALGNAVLRMGDNDTNRRWNGAEQPSRTGTPVADLQRALTAVGTYTAGVDGAFGNGTQLSLRRFQWFAINCRYRLRVPAGAAVSGGTFDRYVQNMAVLLNGQCNATMAAELAAWQSVNARTTTTLVRVPISRFAQIERSTTFKTMSYPNAGDTEVLANQGFVAGLDSLNTAAGTAKVQLRLNQVFRDQGVPPSGTVVPPASKSQHLIGHAADLNIVDGQTVVTSAMLLANTAPKPATDLIAAAKVAGLRWGGDFGTRDPPHFDLQIDAATEAYTMNYFFCQRFYSLQHPIRPAS